MPDVAPRDITDVQKKIRLREFSVLDFILPFLERAARAQPAFSAFTSINMIDVISQAQVLDEKIAKGQSIGRLAGIPLSIKDTIEVKGMVTSCCSHTSIYDFSTVDADVVRNLRNEGAIIIGKANCHEFAFGGPSFDLPFQPSRNPWNRAYFPGGSSSGSGVSLAAGLCMGSIGTDTAGSIRLPSSHCGVVGLKATYDGLSMRGVRALSKTMDHLGPMAHTVEDCRIIFDVLRQTPNDSLGSDSSGLGALRFGVFDGVWGLEDRLHPDVLRIYRNAKHRILRKSGHVYDVTLPSLELIHSAASLTMMYEVALNYAVDVRRRYTEYGSVFRSRVLAGDFVCSDQFSEAQDVRGLLIREVDQIFDEVDFILMPVSFSPPGRLTAVDRFYFLKDMNINILANFTGHPSITLPFGRTSGGLPIGLQILGRKHDEKALFDIAEWIQV